MLTGDAYGSGSDDAVEAKWMVGRVGILKDQRGVVEVGSLKTKPRAGKTVRSRFKGYGDRR